MKFDFLVMELVEGESLGKVLARRPLPAAQGVRQGLEIAAALEESHAQGVVHGDLKPGNIMVTKFGLKLLDFGLARQLGLASVSDSVARLPKRVPRWLRELAVHGARGASRRPSRCSQ